MIRINQEAFLPSLHPNGDESGEDTNKDEIFQKEIKDPEYRKQLEKNNRYNINIFQFTHEKAMHGDGVLLSMTIGYRRSEYIGWSFNRGYKVLYFESLDRQRFY